MFDRETNELLRHILRQQLLTNNLLRRQLGVEQSEDGFLYQIEQDLRQHTPTSITFKEITMLPPVAGNTLVFTGTISPAGAVFPSDTVFTLTSNNAGVTPTVDVTGLIVTIPLPATFVDDPANPFSVAYAATSASTGVDLTATITPSIPAVLPTGITFTQTT